MNVTKTALIGDPIDEVPKRSPGYHCNARKSGDGIFTGYCRARAGKGTDEVGEGRCSKHGGNAGSGGARDGAGAPTGADNGNYEHGAYTDHIISDLSEREKDALDALVECLRGDSDPDDSLDTIREQAAELYLKYKRSDDPRFLGAYRRLLSEFNIVEATDQEEIDATAVYDEVLSPETGTTQVSANEGDRRPDDAE